MKESVQISGASPEHESMDFSRLLEEGIRLAQLLSGERWTDFNEHDPGVTILEQLCYALTDLGYRSNYDIEDILAPAPDQTEHPKHTLYTGDQILPCRTLTINDYRKLLYDRILGLKNVWLRKPRPEDVNGIKGLYEVLIQLYEEDRNLDYEQRDLRQKRILFEVSNLLNANRNLTEDIHRVAILEPKAFSIDATIEIGNEPSPETILAHIIYGIENELVPYPVVSSLGRQMEQGVPPDELFTGPLLQHGLIDDKTLADLPDVIKINDIESIISEVEGVDNIETVQFKGNHNDTEILVQLHGRVPRLRRKTSTITLIRSGTVYTPDPIRLERKLKGLSDAHQQEEAAARKKMKDVAYRKLPQGTYKNIDTYHSIQHHFPLTYGIGVYGVPEPLVHETGPQNRSLNPWGTRKKREAQARQLKAYLLLFEQMLANAFAQLANTAQLFSLDPHLRQTYFSQPITHIPDVAPILAQTHRNLALSDLKEDMVIEVEGRREEDRLVARYIRTRDRTTRENFSVVGRIEKLDRRRQRLTVYGEPFVWTDNTRISEAGKTRTARILREGEMVEVEARREEPASEAFRIRIKRDLEEDDFKIKATGTLGPASFDAADNTALTVNGVTFNVVYVPPEETYHIKVINVIESIDDEGTLTVGGIPFILLSNTIVRPEGLDLAPGMMVELNGMSGEHVAVRVQIKPPGTRSTFGVQGKIEILTDDSLTLFGETYRFTRSMVIVDQEGRALSLEYLQEGTEVEVESRFNQIVAEHIQTQDPDLQNTFVVTALVPAVTTDLLTDLDAARERFNNAGLALKNAQDELAAAPDDTKKAEAFRAAKGAFEAAKDAFLQTADTVKEAHDDVTVSVGGVTQIDDEEGLEIYQRTLKKLVFEFDDFLGRRGRMLDHLLARFNERFDNYLLDLLDTRPSGKKDAFYEELIQSKINFLENYVDLSQARGAGVNFFSPYRLHITNKYELDPEPDHKYHNYNPGYGFTLHSYGIESKARQILRREEIIEYGTQEDNYRIMYARRPRVAIFMVDSEAKPLAYGWLNPRNSEAHALLKEDDALEKAVTVLITFFERLKDEEEGPGLIETCVLPYPPGEGWSDPPPPLSPPPDWPRSSGLERRARLLLGIDDRTRWPLAPAKDTSVYKDVLQEGEAPTEAFRLVGPDDAEASGSAASTDTLNFSFEPPDPSEHILKHILGQGTQKRNYRIVESSGGHCRVLFPASASEKETSIVYQAGSKRQAHEAVENLTGYLDRLSRQMEGFYILEHILLRPTPEPPPDMRYGIRILDDDDRIRLTSYDLPNRTTLDQRLENILRYGVAEANYKLVEKERREIGLILRDADKKLIAEGEEEFSSKARARQGIKNLTQLIRTISEDTPLQDQHVQIVEERIARVEGFETLGRFGIRILDEDKRIRLGIYHLPDEATRTQRLEDILVYGSDKDCYTSKEKDNGEISLILYDTAENILAYGMEEFPTEADAEKGIEGLAHDIERLSMDKSLHDDHIQLIPEIPPELLHEPDAAAFYNFRISVFFPDWPARFQSKDFRLFAERVIRENAPAHVAIQTHWLNVEKMQTFEDLYERWVRARTWRMTDLFGQRASAVPVVMEEEMKDLKQWSNYLLRLTQRKAAQKLYDEARILAAKALDAAKKVQKQLEADPKATQAQRVQWEARIKQIEHVMQLIDFIIAELGYPAADEQLESVNDLADQLKQFILGLKPS